MISVYESDKSRIVEGEERTILELRGLSTDEKPTEEYDGTRVDNGSIFIEMDTGKIYMFDLENTEWKEI